MAGLCRSVEERAKWDARRRRLELQNVWNDFGAVDDSFAKYKAEQAWKERGEGVIRMEMEKRVAAWLERKVKTIAPSKWTRSLILVWCLLSLPAFAQQPTGLGTPDVQWAAHVYQPGLQAALFTIDLLSEHIVCDQALPGTPQGQAMIAWEDWHLPSGSGKWCLWVDGPPGPLRNIAPGTYELGLTATVDGVDHPESVRYTFVKKGDETVFIIARNVRVL